MRLASYLRQSLTDKASSSPESQRMVIAAFCVLKGWVILHEFCDIGGKRSETDNHQTRPQFQALMKLARAGKLDAILVSSQERFGTPDVYAFYTLMGELRNLGVEVWDCTAGIVLNPPGGQLGPVFQAFAGTVIDTGEQQSRSKAVLRGQIQKTMQGRYIGGNIAYGTAIRCLTPDGQETWRCEMVGRKLYEVKYADGRTIVRNHTPCGDKGETDRVVFCRSSYPDRIKAVQHIFQAFIAGVGAQRIANDLNALGYRLPGGRHFYSGIIQRLIDGGIIYTGRAAWGRRSLGKFFQAKNGTPVSVDNPKGKMSVNPMEDWLVGDQIFEPIITPEVFRRSYELLVARARPRQRQNPTAVYAGLLVCEDCGAKMTANGEGKYQCSTYAHNGGPKSSCHSVPLRQTTVDTYVNTWLEEIGKTLNWTGEKAPVEALYKQSEITGRMKDLHEIVEHYLADKLAAGFEFKLTKDGARIFTINGVKVKLPGYKGSLTFLRNLLATVEASENAKITDRAAHLEARKSHLLAVFPEAENKSLRASIVSELNQIDSQLELVLEGKTDYAQQRQELVRSLMSLWQASKRARSLVEPEAKRAALMELISEIRVKTKEVRRGMNLHHTVDTIQIIPYVQTTSCRDARLRSALTITFEV